MITALLDTNIVLRHVLQDDPVQSPKASSVLAQIEAGSLNVVISPMVVVELVFVLERTYHQPKSHIQSIVEPILGLPSITVVDKRMWPRVFELYVNRNVSFPDAYHCALMERMGIKTAISFDKDFDRLPGIVRDVQ